MNRHISMSILSTTIVPRNITQVSVIPATDILFIADLPFITHLSIIPTMANAGIRENIDSARQL
jgi:hypothetical protein